MCKRASYKLVRQMTNKALTPLDRNKLMSEGRMLWMTVHDNRIIREGIMAYCCSIYDILKDSYSFPDEYFNDFLKALKNDLEVYDFSEIISELKGIYDEYISFIKDLHSGNHCFDPKSGLLLIQWWSEKGLFNVSFYDRDYLVRNTRNTAQVLLFLSKLELEGDMQRLEAESIEKWKQAECNNKRQDRFEKNNPAMDYIYDLLSAIVDYWFVTHGKKYHVDLTLCCNGSGSVNILQEVAIMRNAPINKWLNLEINNKCYHLLNSILESYTLDELFGGFASLSNKRLTSQYLTVPKNVTSRRGISLEPPALQFIQQGIRKDLYKYIRESRDTKINALGNFVFLEDSTYNRSAAQQGSICDDYATIDLSSASDSVRVCQVKKIFKNQHNLLKWLIATRTSFISVGGKEIEVSKFAGMGSGTCFAVETIIFASIAVLGSLVTWDEIVSGIVTRDDLLDRLGKDASIFALVFGDDIIVTKNASHTVVKLLKVLGFHINGDKSFLTGYFKESCGGNYYHGIDITPLKWNVPFGTEKAITANAFSSLVSFANNAYKRRLPILREHCIQRLITSGNLPRFTDDIEDTSAIYSTQPTNYLAKTTSGKFKCRTTEIYGTKLLAHQGWPRNVWFHERKLLYSRIKYRCTQLKLSKDDFDDPSLFLDVFNSKYYCDNVNEIQARGITSDDLYSHIGYLQWSTTGQCTTNFDIDIIRSHDRIHRVYHLTEPQPRCSDLFKSEPRLGFGLFE